MARKPRIDPPGSWHHVMNRGANHQPTFVDDHDRREFLSVLDAAVRRFEIEIHAYCLMPNHYHLLIRSPLGQLSRAMKFIGQSYTQTFNHRYDRDGALFRGRFHSTVVDSDNYLDTVARYIHRNPVLSSMDDDSVLDTFPWSSLAAYEGRSHAPIWLSTNEIIGRFPDPDRYAEFVRNIDETNVEPQEQQARKHFDNPLRQGVVLGNADFLAGLIKKAGEMAERYRPWILPPAPDIPARRPVPDDQATRKSRASGVRPPI